MTAGPGLGHRMVPISGQPPARCLTGLTPLAGLLGLESGKLMTTTTRLPDHLPGTVSLSSSFLSHRLSDQEIELKDGPEFLVDPVLTVWN